ncbi:MAG TPA: FAD-binding protein, partial [Polyangiales bacterium]
MRSSRGRAGKGHKALKAPSFDGDLKIDELSRKEAGRDFGGLVARTPRAVLYAKSIDDVRRGIEFAKREKMQVAARGQGHTTRGQAQVEGGLVIDTRFLDRVEVENGFAKVGAGCLWREL